ncbi:hypothetical protein AVEN_108008-1 [Araneus ventricosus]|uniref:Retrovirus-related Pol polyprotein from transposon TNT 1-94 n=1 Tax=Araneus ventricosus TaxID=182803 RepID=A0A4Y2DRT6_ARAVE|nr:hypothetical protein AVEN_108008-1 [Araneus ventricosus]
MHQPPLASSTADQMKGTGRSGVKRKLIYLKRTKNRKLVFRETRKQLQDYSDADWEGDTSDRMSFSGYMLLLAAARVSWLSNQQTITALPSTEAEYVAMCHVAKEALWINSLLREIL